MMKEPIVYNQYFSDENIFRISDINHKKHVETLPT